MGWAGQGWDGQGWAGLGRARMGRTGMGRGGLFHCIGENVEEQRICVVPLLPQQRQLHNQTLKKSQGSNACPFVFLKGPGTSIALDRPCPCSCPVFREPALDPTCHLVKKSCDLKEAMFGTDL